MNKQCLEEMERIESVWRQSLIKRKHECGENHKYIIWFDNFQKNENYKIKGVCHYCLTELERLLD
jgi:hypothetical protein